MTTTSPAVSFDRMPPSDVAAEECVIGGMMMDKDAISDVMGIIQPADHYRPAHQVIHAVIVELFDAGEPVNPVSVSARLVKRGELGQAGGGECLHRCFAAVPTAANAGYFARIVREHAIRRRLIERSTRVVQLAYEATGDADALVERAREEISAVTGTAPAEGLSTDELFFEVVDSLENQTERGLLTGWADLDALINGMTTNELIVIAGAPAVGKSAAALNVAAEVSLRQGLPSVFFSLEMGRHEVMTRLISMTARIPMGALMKRELTPEHWKRVLVAQERIVGSPLVIDSTPGCSLSSIRARLRDMARTSPARLAVVDQIQLLTGTGRQENRQVEVSAFSRGLKLVTGEFGIPLIAVSQLNRSRTNRGGDERPELTDLKDSSAIESDASVVILLHREDVNGKETPHAGEIDFIVAKNRNGPPAVVTLAFQGEYSRCVNMAWSPSSALKG